jgi:hypothetical protein
MALDQGILMKALDWGYDVAVSGVPGLYSAEELAASYMRRGGTPVEQTNALIRWQIAKASTSGFITGLGGLVTLPVAVPANLSSVLYVQLRMIAAIAVIGRHDIRADQVRTLAYVCLCGSAAMDVLKDVGIQLGMKLTQTAISKISGETLWRINQRVGFSLVSKFGGQGVLNLGRAVPLVAGLIGGTIDGVSTNTIGNVARDALLDAG